MLAGGHAGFDACGDEVVDEALVSAAVGAVPLDVDDLATEVRQVGHADEAPLGVGAAVDEHGLGVIVEQLSRPLQA